MKETLKNIYYVLMALVMIDAFILMTSIAQLAYEGQTGYWSPFWRIQAQFILKFLN